MSVSCIKRLKKEFEQISKDINPLYSVYADHINKLRWFGVVLGAPDTIFEGGIFRFGIDFPENYPFNPPTVYFIDKLPHPNIYQDGRVCISTLHFGVDATNYEQASERWSPQHNVQSVLISIISMLSTPNFESPANVEISKMWKNEPDKYKSLAHSFIAKLEN